MSSGYTQCACRDCFDVAVSSDDSKPELCSDCEEAGCSADGDCECSRDDAYGCDAEEEEQPPSGPAPETHYVYGLGRVGCLYDTGPHHAETREGAIEGALCIFDDLPAEEIEAARANLRMHGIHYFSDSAAAGVDYCEVTEQAGPCPDEEE